MTSIESDVKKAMKEKNAVIGTKSVMRGIKNRLLSEIVVARNCSRGTRDDIERYASLSGVSLKAFEGNSDQLGQTCGKPFNIVLLGIKK